MSAAWDCDLFVVGGGSGGVRAARVAAAAGARVILAERDSLGGTCVNLGCIPKKYMYYAAEYGTALSQAQSYGWELGSTPPSFDWPRFRAARDAELRRLNGLYEQLLSDAGVQLLRGSAQLLGAHRVAVGKCHYRAQHILLAVGSQPWLPPQLQGQGGVLSSDELLQLPALPRRLAIVGGGYIAVELASIMAGLGVECSLLYRGSLFLRGFDRGVRAFLRNALRASGLRLRFNCEVVALSKDSEGITLQLSRGNPLRVDCVLCATGRRPALSGLGLEHTSVQLDASGAIDVGSDYRSDDASIFAVGDVVSGPALTPVAIAAGEALARQLFEDAPLGPRYAEVPTAVFSRPPMAAVGLSAEEAKALHGRIAVREARFVPMKQRLLSGSAIGNLVKIVALPGDEGRVLGLHMVGADAPEIIQSLAVAIQGGCSVATLHHTLALHPTTAEEFISCAR